MGYEIKIIKCPRLNEHHYGSGIGSREIAVYFDGKSEPESVMCDRYDPEKGCLSGREEGSNMAKYKNCIFSEWKPLKRDKE